jgi:hypothetical protein
MRAAIFYAPETDDPLSQAGAIWLGRDAITGADLPHASPKWTCIARTPARYGFHATLKPPMYLTGTLNALSADVAALAARTAPFDLPPLKVGLIDEALALLTVAPSPILQSLCDACVRDLDRHRLPPSEAELGRRNQMPISPLERSLLARWGYPYVFERWLFHMTLSVALPPKAQTAWQTMAQEHFAPSLATPRKVTSLALFTEQDGEGFRLEKRFLLTGPAQTSSILIGSPT